MSAGPDSTGSSPAIETDILIAGGGPCGLMLANELGRRGIRCLLVDPKPGTVFNPQANATQARTMEPVRFWSVSPVPADSACKPEKGLRRDQQVRRYDISSKE